MLFYNDPQYWRERADEARAMTKFVLDPDVIAAMLRIAIEYDRIIHLTEQRLVEPPKRPGSDQPRFDTAGRRSN